MSAPTSNFEAETITTHELLERSTRAALDLQRKDGSFPPGKNGVYDETETPVRTTAHWLTTLVAVYEITDDDEFADAATAAADYLLAPEARPYGYTFHSRNANGKNSCDGLVGQAAPVRALGRAGPVLNHPDLIDTAIEVWSLHPFDNRLDLWEAVEVNGTRLSFDRTLNHQVFFASSAVSLIDESNVVENRIHSFLDSLGKNMQVHSDGVIRHYIRPPLRSVLNTVFRSPRHWELTWNEFAARYHSSMSNFREKERGYHPSILAAFSQLRLRFPDHHVWNHPNVRTAFAFAETDEYENQIRKRGSSYGSMVPALTHAVLLYRAGKPSLDEIRPWIELAIDRKYDSETDLLTRNAVDPTFQASKLNLLTELPNIRIEVGNSG